MVNDMAERQQAEKRYMEKRVRDYEKMVDKKETQQADDRYIYGQKKEDYRWMVYYEQLYVDQKS